MLSVALVSDGVHGSPCEVARLLTLYCSARHITSVTFYDSH